MDAANAPREKTQREKKEIEKMQTEKKGMEKNETRKPLRALLERIPQPDGGPDAWNGHALPPRYESLHAKEGTAWFVDGGNAEILGAPHFSLQKLRAVGVHYPQKRVIRREQTVLLVRCPEGWNVFDERGGTELVIADELPDAIGMVRERVEHVLSLACLQEDSGVVVLDGDNAPEGCVALQKSSSTLTTRGFPLSSVLTAAGPWFARFGEVYATKLDRKARHVFLIHGTVTLERLRVLAHYSHDLIFPGYPGGLVLADRLARVSNEERESLRVHAKTLLRELRERVVNAEAAKDSHDILDSL
jgi:hypothetical protein